MKKFEFTGEVKNVYGIELKRIRALIEIDLGWKIIKPGDLGGWLEKEENLSHDGNAWVCGDAWVYGNAWVCGDAWVYGNAKVCGDAWVYGDAKVCGDAWVYGDAKVYGNAEVCGDAWVYGNAEVCGDAFIFKTKHLLTIGAIGSRNAFTTFFRNKKGKIKVKCGCFLGTLNQFLTKVEQTHGDNKFAAVYRACVTVALEQIDATPYTDDDNEENGHVSNEI